MSKNKNRGFQSNLLDRAPVAEEGHVNSEATAQEPESVEATNSPKIEEPVVESATDKKHDYGFHEETAPRVYGVVNSKCKKLFVRREPNKQAEPVSVINSGTKVRIKKDESTDTFYKISLETGMSGFAMKEFIDEV